MCISHSIWSTKSRLFVIKPKLFHCRSLVLVKCTDHSHFYVQANRCISTFNTLANHPLHCGLCYSDVLTNQILNHPSQLPTELKRKTIQHELNDGQVSFKRRYAVLLRWIAVIGNWAANNNNCISLWSILSLYQPQKTTPPLFNFHRDCPWN